MARIKLNIRGLSDSELVQFAQQHVTAMTGNANFATPTPAAAAFQTTLDAFSDKLGEFDAAYQAAQQKTVEKNDARATLENSIGARAAYVESVSGGDEAKILSAAFAVRAPGAPVGILPAPGNLVATMGDLAGTIDLMWDRVRGANTYVVEVCPDPLNEANWRQIGLPTKSSFTSNSLTSGSKYWFRVAAVGAAGQGPWSDQAMKMAP